MEYITLVTGGSRGIGASTVQLCAANGHAVAINYRDDAEAANAIRKEIESAGGTAITVGADMASETDILRMFETIDRELGCVTGLVNNAGIHGPRGRLDGLTEVDIDSVLSVNLKGCFICAREAVKRMSTKYGGKGGAIVNVSSGSAVLGEPHGGVLYAASKGGLNSLNIGLSQEVAGEGIRVNSVSPGLTETDMPPQEKIDRLGPNIPIGRIAQPKEIAEAIFWLLSDKASYTAGANIRVGGGRV